MNPTPSAPAIEAKPNTKGRATAFTTLTPFRDRWSRLREHVVLAIVRRTRHPEPETRQRRFLHYGLWAIIPARKLRGLPEKSFQHGALLFMSAYTGDLLDYLRGFTEHLSGPMDELWNQCVGWPGADDYSACVRFIVCYRRTSPVFYNAYGHSGVDDIRSSLRTRSLLDEFATLSPAMSDSEFESKYDELVQRLWRNGEREMDA